jgi:hypothetical protein
LGLNLISLHFEDDGSMLENGTPPPRAPRLSLVVLMAMVMLAATAGQARPSALAGRAAADLHAAAPGRSVVYSSIGPVLTIWDLDVDAATLTKRNTVTLPGFITEATLHPSRKTIYIAWGRFPGGFQIHSQPHEHGLSAFRIDSATGQRRRHRHSRDICFGV